MMVQVAEFESVEEALVIKSMLDFYEIPALFVEAYAARCDWLAIRSAGKCHIEVSQSCIDDARWLIANPLPILEFDPYDNTEISLRKNKIDLLLICELGPIGMVFLWERFVRKLFRL